MNDMTNPWENRSQIGLPQALWQTIKLNLVNPDQFFRNLKIKDSIVEPYLYSIVLLAIIEILSSCVNSLLKLDANDISVFYRMLLLFAGVFISTAINHPFVKLLHGKGDIKATFNVYCYGYTSACIFYLVPIGGGAVSLIWGMLITIAGFKCVHKMTTGLAFAAFFLPLLLMFLVSSAMINFL